MAAKKQIRQKVDGYKGIIYYEVPSRVRKGQTEKHYYIRARVGGKLVEEPVGRSIENGTTPLKAMTYLAKRREGTLKSPAERREEERVKKEAEQNRWTVDRIWQEYKKNTPNKGIISDDNRYRNYIAPTFGNKTLPEIQQLDIDRLRLKISKKINPKTKKTLSPATIKHVLELLRRIGNYAFDELNIETFNFSFKKIMRKVKVDNETTEDLTPEQLSDLLAAIERSDHQIAKGMMLMALYSGLRRGEMFRLKWEHISFERGFMLLVEPKGGKAQKLPLNQQTRKVLESMPRTSQYVFPGRNGEQRVDIKRPVNRIKRDAGLPDSFRPLHGLRHVFATNLANNGVDMFVLQQLLTHKSSQMTERYAHARDERLREASELAGDIVNKSDKVVNLKT